MAKRIGYSVMYFIIFFVVSIIMQKFVFANPNYMDISVGLAVGASIGMFMGYGIKNEEDD